MPKPSRTPIPSPSWLLEYHWKEPDNPIPWHLIPGWEGKFSEENRSHHFNFSSSIKALCLDIRQYCPELGHIDPSRILFSMTPARNRKSHGLQARVTPLRLRGGERVGQHHGTAVQVQRYFVDGLEMLYLVTFCMPRYLDQPFEEKLITLFHELHHISPAFDGDLRRQQGRFSLHSHRKKEYDSRMVSLARDYLRRSPNSSLYRFLRLDCSQLQHQLGPVIAWRVPYPHLVPIQELSKPDF